VSVAVAVLLLSAVFWIMPDGLRLTPHAVAAPPPLQGYTIAVIADLHAGASFIDEGKLDAIVRQTNAANPDLVLLAGDFSGGMQADIIAAHLSRLEARLGVYAVLGAGDVPQDDEAPMIGPALEKVGIFVLGGSYIVLGTARGPVILTWLGEGRPIRLPPGGTVLCLAAAVPDLANVPARCALTISGPPHGDQLALPFLRAALVRRDGGRTLFVSPGIGGATLSARLDTPEISLLKIQ